ncbi:MAG TPA: flagellar biosynthesis anti-sigma factor FlgM [Chloroflexota bacterium]|nr:flagellar biosynthesis anti-sigma factor FlgM [Chloroflexota bacterium]
MKIDHGGAREPFAAYRKALEAVPAATQGPQQANPWGATPAQVPDSAQISAQSRQLAQAHDSVRSTPATRATMIDEIKAQIKSGTYTIDDHDLASKLLKPRGTDA